MMKEMKMGTFDYNGESYNFKFKTSLSAFEKQMFVKTVVNNLVDEDGYDVVVKDLIFDFVIIEMFSNIDTSFIEVKDDEGNNIPPIIIVEHFLEKTNVVDIIKANIEDDLLEELNRAVNLNVQYLTGIHFNPLNEALANLFSAIEKKTEEVDLKTAMDMAQKFAGITKDFTVENIVNAYMDTDIHKENLTEIKEVKKSKKKQS